MRYSVFGRNGILLAGKSSLRYVPRYVGALPSRNYDDESMTLTVSVVRRIEDEITTSLK